MVLFFVFPCYILYMRKKILFCITQSTAGGAQQYVHDLATHLPPDQFETVIVTGGSGPLVQRTQEKGIRTIFVPGLNRDISLIRELQAFFNLTKIFIREKPDIIHLNSTKIGAMGACAAFVARLLTLNFKSRVIFTVHGWGFREDRNIVAQMAIFAVSWIAARFHHHTITINSSDYADARAFIPHANISLISLGIKPIEFLTRDQSRAFFSQRLSLPHNTFLIGITAELTKNKGIPYLLRALHMNAQSPSPMHIHAIVMGEGTERANLEKQIKEFGLENHISLLGFIPDAKIYLKAFDAFVLPSVKEGLPYSLMEAMAAGLPVIATNVGGIPDLITHEVSGMIVPPKKSDTLHQHINTLYASNHVRERIGKQANEIITNNYSLERMIASTAHLYHELT